MKDEILIIAKYEKTLDFLLKNIGDELVDAIKKPRLSKSASASISQQVAMPLMRETMTINDGHGNMIEVYKDDIEKQLNEGLYKHLGLNLDYGA